MKILFISGTLGRGGAERQLLYLSDFLNKNHNKVYVFCLSQGEYYEEELVKKNVSVIYVGKSSSRFRRLIEIIIQTRKIKPDVIFSFHFYTNIYAGITGKILRIKSFGSIRSNAIREKKLNGLWAWMHYCLPNNIVANSIHGIKNAKRVFYNRNIQYLPNYIDENLFEFHPKNNKSDKLNLINISRLYPVKQVHLYIDLIEKLSHIIDVKGIIIGDGALKSELMVKAKDLNISFVGEIDDIRPFLYKADYLVSTSKNEGTPNIFLEAISCGTPIISLYHEGLDDFINNNIFPKTEDVIEMSHAIINNKFKFDLVHNKKFLSDNHSEQVVLNKFMKIINV